MTIIAFIIYAAVLGLVAYLVTTFVPMPDPIKHLIVIGTVLLVLLLLLHALGLTAGFPVLR